MMPCPQVPRSAAPTLLLALAILPAAASLLAGDWPQYLGPNHNAISTEVIRTNWTEQPPRQVWRVGLDPGLSSLSVAGGRAFTMVRRPVAGQGNREHVLALDADTGQELWAVPFDNASYPNGGVGSDDGPRGTPAVDGDHVYAFGAYLKLVCLRVTDGGVVWERDFVQDFNSNVIPWQNAASPIVLDDLIFVNCNAATGGCLLAVNKFTGQNAWRNGPNDRMTQASPVIATIDGIRQVVFFTQSGLVARVPETGDELWRFPIAYNSTSFAASPVVGSNIVYWSAAYGTGGGAVRVQSTPSGFTTNRLWATRGALQNHWCTPVHWKDHLYGHFNQSILQLKCVQADSGNVTWSEPDSFNTTRFGYGSVLIVNGLLLVLSDGEYLDDNDGGELLLIHPDPAAYREVDKFRALNGKCWNTFAISDGRIYLRSTREAVCLDVSLPAPPLRLATGPSNSSLPFRFQITSDDGSPLPTGALAGTSILASTDPFLPLTNWVTLTLTPIPTGGWFEIEDPDSTNLASRYYLLQTSP